jgi:hypothetical protein
MSLFGSPEPGKCCYWEDGKSSKKDGDHAPCKTFKDQERGKSEYWVDGINLNQHINSNLSINGKPLYYTLHIFKHVESVDLECNNETQLNEYLKELIDNNMRTFNKLSGLKNGSVELCLNDSNNNNILLMVSKTLDDKYLIFHLSKRNDETCMRADWEKGVDNYKVPKLDNNINPIQYSLFKTEQMDEEDREAIKELRNSPVVGSPVLGSPASVVLSSPGSEKQKLPEGSPKTPRSLKKALEVVEKTANSLESKRTGREKLDPVRFREEIEKIKKKEDENNIKKKRWEERKREIEREIEIDKIEREIEIEREIDKIEREIERERALNPNSPTAAEAAKGLNVDAAVFSPAAPIPTPTPASSLRRSAPVWSPKNPPISKGGTKKRIKKRKTKKRKTKSKKTKRKH